MKLLTFLLALPLTLLCQSNPVVRFQTNVGNIDVELFADVAPKTVANFLNYVNKGAYTNSFIHRSVRTFIIQGGGYTVSSDNVTRIIPDPPVQSEYKISNTRGTIAMALSAGDPNSGNSQWFFNLSDTNAASLDAQSFTVFGKVRDNAGLAVMDSIANVPVFDSPWSSAGADGGGTPLRNYRQGQILQPSNFITIQSIRPFGEARSAKGFGALAEAAPGSYLEIEGTGLAGTTRTWEERDFNNGAAPTVVDDVRVTVGGQDAYISYISPTQVNVQIPANVAPGANVPVVVTYQGQEKLTTSVAIKEVSAGLLAPDTFKVNDTQYVVAQHPDLSFVGNGFVPSVPNSPALTGEVITILGIGFGPVSPASATLAGRIAEGLSSTVNPVQFFFADKEARVEYSGLVPGLVGCYQFNVVVPPGLGTQDVQLRVSVGGVSVPQTLYIPVREAQ